MFRSLYGPSSFSCVELLKNKGKDVYNICTSYVRSHSYNFIYTCDISQT
jgi:hypothetical protein